MRATQVEPEPSILKRVSIRLIDASERELFDTFLKEDHYLHQPNVPGPGLRYFAELDGQIVAALLFSQASLHTKARELWIKWSPRQRVRRLPFVINNTRFLILPDRHKLPNLASCVLGMVLRRLSQDWLEHHGNPVLLVESFVDESQYRGTCYKACGFFSIGATSGFGRTSRDFYLKHDKPKQLFIRELHPHARKLLSQPRLPADLADMESSIAGPCPFRAPSLDNLYQRFRRLKDPRQGHGLYHRQAYVFACAAVASVMGGSGYLEFEAISSKFTDRQLRALGCRPDRHKRLRSSSDSTFLRVINACEVREFVVIISEWLQEQEPAAIARLAIDGKCLRGSNHRDGKPLQILSAVTHHLRMTLEQIPIEEKTNEIPNFIPLLKALKPPPGTLVTADAMHCQQESARHVVQEMGGDYLFGLKGNQSGILDRAQRLLNQQSFSP